MRHPQRKTAAPGRQPGRGGNLLKASPQYTTDDRTATDLAVAVIAVRYRLPVYVARMYCELHGIGGRHD